MVVRGGMRILALGAHQGLEENIEPLQGEGYRLKPILFRPSTSR